MLCRNFIVVSVSWIYGFLQANISFKEEQQWLRKTTMTLLTNSQEKGPEDEQMDHARKQHKKTSTPQPHKGRRSRHTHHNNEQIGLDRRVRVKPLWQTALGQTSEPSSSKKHPLSRLEDGFRFANRRCWKGNFSVQVLLGISNGIGKSSGHSAPATATYSNQGSSLRSRAEIQNDNQIDNGVMPNVADQLEGTAS
nr:hypothetical protein CFP56_34461 [Quercus suber]